MSVLEWPNRSGFVDSNDSLFFKPRLPRPSRVLDPPRLPRHAQLRQFSKDVYVANKVVPFGFQIDENQRPFGFDMEEASRYQTNATFQFLKRQQQAEDIQTKLSEIIAKMGGFGGGGSGGGRVFPQARNDPIQFDANPPPPPNTTVNRSNFIPPTLEELMNGLKNLRSSKLRSK